MTEDSLEIKIAQLIKRIDDQSRFTRTIVVVCTTAILGVNFYMLTEIFGTLPQLMTGTLLSHLDARVAPRDVAKTGGHR